MNPYDLNEFPIGIASFAANPATADLCKLLMVDYRRNKQLKEKESKKTGTIHYEEFYPRLSKQILDQIDSFLATHYGFTHAELDFIINYDIKYRMGKELDSEGGDNE